MTFTTAQLDKLVASLTAAQTVEFQGRRQTNRSVEEILKAMNVISTGLAIQDAATSKRKPVRQLTPIMIQGGE